MRSLLRGRYLINDLIPRIGLRAVDAVLDRWAPAAKPPVPAHPRRILIALGGHLGDAIIATAAISYVRELLPDAEIGVIVASWGRPPIDAHPDVSRVHLVDHWRLNRESRPLLQKVARWRASRRQATDEIREVGYDIAIDLHPYAPNSATLLASAGVPVRVGYTSGGLGSFYTHPLDFVDGRLHLCEQHARLIATTLGRTEPVRSLHYRLPPAEESDRRTVGERLIAGGVGPSGYVVAHMGAGTLQQEWVPDKWRATMEQLVAAGHEIVCTGLGAREVELAARATANLPGCLNLCGELTWSELLAVVSGAKLVLSLDTSVGHVAAAYDIPTVTLMRTIGRPEHYRPYHPNGTILYHPMPCAPCLSRHGCAHMACVRQIGVSDVIEAVTLRLGALAAR